MVLCQVLGVSESGLYAWRKRPASQRKRADALLTQAIGQVCDKHRGRYGSPRIHRELRDQGSSISRKRVARLMCEAERAARRKHPRVLTTKRDATHPVAQSALKSGIYGTRPPPKWGTDSTYIPTTHGWLYLAVSLDWYSRAGVGWSRSDCCDEQVAENAVTMAVSRRRPKAGLLHHRDRGCQYPSRASRKRLEQMAAVESQSRTGNCWDNAAMERFFGSLKEEGVGNTIYPSHEQARRALFESLEIYSNRLRRHSTLG